MFDITVFYHYHHLLIALVSITVYNLLFAATAALTRLTVALNSNVCHFTEWNTLDKLSLLFWRPISIYGYLLFKIHIVSGCISLFLESPILQCSATYLDIISSLWNGCEWIAITTIHMRWSEFIQRFVPPILLAFLTTACQRIVSSCICFLKIYISLKLGGLLIIFNSCRYGIMTAGNSVLNDLNVMFRSR